MAAETRPKSRFSGCLFFVGGAFAPPIFVHPLRLVFAHKYCKFQRKRDRNLDLVFLFVFKALGSLLDSIEVVSLFYNL